MRVYQQRSHLRSVAIIGLLLLCSVRIITVIAGAATVLPLGGDARSYIAASQAIIHGLPPIGTNGAPFLPEAGSDIPVYLYPLPCPGDHPAGSATLSAVALPLAYPRRRNNRVVDPAAAASGGLGCCYLWSRRLPAHLGVALARSD